MGEPQIPELPRVAAGEGGALAPSLSRTDLAVIQRCQPRRASVSGW